MTYGSGHRRRAVLGAAASLLAAAALAGLPAGAASADSSRGVLMVGNAVAGTVSFIDASTLANLGSIPYWATTSADGNYCYVSLSADNEVSVISYATGAEVARVPVGSFPQRERVATVPQAVIDNLSSAVG